MHRSATPGRTSVRGVNKGIRDRCHIACDICHSLLTCVCVCLGIIFRCWQQRQHIKRGHNMAQHLSINQIKKIEVKSYDFLKNPNIEFVITHQDWSQKETVIKFDLYFDDFAILADILRNLGNDIVMAIVNNKICESKALAEKAQALATE